MNLIINFQEAYKRLDRLCRDCLSSKDGVSEYIKQMEGTPFEHRRFVKDWNEQYRGLKHVRWVRNQLAHEVGASEMGICTVDELNFVLDFHMMIINRKDPLALVYQYRHVSFDVEESSPEEPTKKQGVFKRIGKWLASVFRG